MALYPALYWPVTRSNCQRLRNQHLQRKWASAHRSWNVYSPSRCINVMHRPANSITRTSRSWLRIIARMGPFCASQAHSSTIIRWKLQHLAKPSIGSSNPHCYQTNNFQLFCTTFKAIASYLLPRSGMKWKGDYLWLTSKHPNVIWFSSFFCEST